MRSEAGGKAHGGKLGGQSGVIPAGIQIDGQGRVCGDTLPPLRTAQKHGGGPQSRPAEQHSQDQTRPPDAGERAGIEQTVKPRPESPPEKRAQDAPEQGEEQIDPAVELEGKMVIVPEDHAEEPFLHQGPEVFHRCARRGSGGKL